jgi:hypothetical protein
LKNWAKIYVASVATQTEVIDAQAVVAHAEVKTEPPGNNFNVFGRQLK